MSAVPFTLVPTGRTGGDTQAISDRVKRLQAEARAMAFEHIAELEAALETARALAAEVAGGGEPYPAGIRDLARRLADDVEARSQAIQVIVQRSIR